MIDILLLQTLICCAFLTNDIIQFSLIFLVFFIYDKLYTLFAKICKSNVVY